MKEIGLSQENREEIEGLIEEAFETLGNLTEFPEDADDSGQVIAALHACVEAVRAGRAPGYLGDAEKIAFALGALWGDEVHKACGWEWILLDVGNGSPLFALVPPDRAAAVRPQLFLYRLMMEPSSDNTVALLFDMLRAGQLPPGGPRSYTLVG